MGESKDAIKREIFHKLSTSTGLRPEWGILTGIRPVKLCGELIDAHGLDEARRVLKNEYLIDDSKIDVIVKMYDYQIASFGKAKENSVGMYIGIPFVRLDVYTAHSSQVKPKTKSSRPMLIL